MKKNEFRNEKLYAATIFYLRSWLKSGLITREEYDNAEETIRAKYSPKTSELLMNIDLI